MTKHLLKPELKSVPGLKDSSSKTTRILKFVAMNSKHKMQEFLHLPLSDEDTWILNRFQTPINGHNTYTSSPSSFQVLLELHTLNAS